MRRKVRGVLDDLFNRRRQIGRGVSSRWPATELGMKGKWSCVVSSPEVLAGWLVGEQAMPAGVGGLENGLSGGGDGDRCDLLEMGAESIQCLYNVRIDFH